MTSLTAASTATPRDRRVPAQLVLAAVVLVGAAIIAAIGLVSPVPSTPDEAIYLELARHLGAAGRFEILGVPFPGWTYGPAFVALIAPITRFAGTAQDAYVAIRMVNAVVFASAAIPAFFLAVRAVSRRAALIVAAITIALPASVYATKVMTESLAYPIVLWTVLAALRVLERPTIRRQSALVALSITATLVRYEFLPLGLLVLLFGSVGDGRAIGRKIRPFLPLAAVLGTIGAAGLLLLDAASTTTSDAGAHGFNLQQFSITRFGATAIGSLGAIDLYTGVVPVACLIYLLLSISRGAPWLTSGMKTAALAATGAGAALLLTSSVYLSTVPADARPTIPSDRYLFYLAPLLLIVLAAWIEAGCPRTKGIYAAAAIGAVFPVAAVFVALSSDPTATINAIAFLPWALPWIATAGRHRPALMSLGGSKPILLALFLGSYCAMCAYRFTRRKVDPHALLRPALFVVTVTAVCAYFANVSPHSYSLPAGWLDQHTKPGTVALWVSAPTLTESQSLREIVGANTNLSAVYFVHKPDSLGLQQVERRAVERADGTLTRAGRPLIAPYVITSARTRIVGTLVARAKGFAIYRTRRPVQVAAGSPSR